MREIYGFLRLASRLSNPFGHPKSVRKFWFCKLALVTCVNLRLRLARAFEASLLQTS